MGEQFVSRFGQDHFNLANHITFNTVMDGLVVLHLQE